MDGHFKMQRWGSSGRAVNAEKGLLIPADPSLTPPLKWPSNQAAAFRASSSA